MIDTNNTFQIRKNIRTYMRFLRKSLTFTYQYDKAIKISKTIFNYSFIYNSKNIALFLPFDGEINTFPLIYKLFLKNKNIFLPIITSFEKKELLFVHFKSFSTLHRNKYNILEPYFNIKNVVSICDLDTVIVPLVAFDKKGSRLGMGGGFYDVFLKKTEKQKIIIVGLSYDFQLVNYIPKYFWDISLPIVLTPNKIWIF